VEVVQLGACQDLNPLFNSRLIPGFPQEIVQKRGRHETDANLSAACEGVHDVLENLLHLLVYLDSLELTNSRKRAMEVDLDLTVHTFPVGHRLYRLTQGRLPPLAWFYQELDALYPIVMGKIFSNELLRGHWVIEVWQVRRELQVLDLRGPQNEDTLGQLMESSGCRDYSHRYAYGIPDNYNLAENVCRQVGPGVHGWISHAPWFVTKDEEVMICAGGHFALQHIETINVADYLGLEGGDAELPEYVAFMQKQMASRSI
jgi:hypothetical protein